MYKAKRSYNARKAEVWVSNACPMQRHDAISGKNNAKNMRDAIRYATL
jgi:hypothetical protein